MTAKDEVSLRGRECDSAPVPFPDKSVFDQSTGISQALGSALDRRRFQGWNRRANNRMRFCPHSRIVLLSETSLAVNFGSNDIQPRGD